MFSTSETDISLLSFHHLNMTLAVAEALSATAKLATLFVVFIETVPDASSHGVANCGCYTAVY